MAAKLARFSWLPGGLAAALVVAVGNWVYSPASLPLELNVYDRMMNSVEVAPSRDVAIVAIDDASLAQLGEWPWPRDVHASLIDKLKAEGASVVAFTFPFDTARRTSEREKVRAALALLESSNLGSSEQARQLRKLLGDSAAGRNPDAHLARSMAAHGNVILPVHIRLNNSPTDSTQIPARFAPGSDASVLQRAANAEVTMLPAPVFLAEASGIGHTYIEPDSDGVVRTSLAAVRVGSGLVPSLSAVITGRALDISPNEMTFHSNNALTLGTRRTPLDSTQHSRPRYFPPSGVHAFQQYPYWQVLSGGVPKRELRDKVVLIGLMNSDNVDDSITTPVSKATPPVVAMASAVSSSLSAQYYSRPGYAPVVEWGVVALVLLFSAFMLPAAGVAIGGMTTVLLIVLLAGSEVMLLRSSHVWLHLMLPCIALAAAYGLYLVGELIRRANIRTGDGARDPGANLRSLGQTFHKQGQLDLAFETYQRCALDAPTMELLYNLGMDFERRAQLAKASAVYTYIATRDPNYRELKARRARVREEPLTRAPATRGSLVHESRETMTHETATPVPPVKREPPRPIRPRQPAFDLKDHEATVPDLDASMPGRSSPKRTLGRYEIERELGKGAMGIVYLGRDPKINRVVAIKAIPLAEEFEEDDLAEARARFFREAEMAGRLNHPAIVTVYDAGEDNGLAYIAMEYLRGHHLSTHTDSKQLLTPKSVMLLVARVAEALHYAHRQNVVHRDIKPANIMFNPETDELKITDFGIARLTDTSRTKTGIVLGTPSFMSPEQLEGRALDGRSDQFALGVSLYQLLCGQLPFRADSMPRLMQKIATEPHTPIRTIRPDLPAEVETIIDRALSKSADDRYVTCAEMAMALRTVAGPPEKSAAQAEHEWLLP
ncbi:CHASE2 domain-containing serine/threonine-protein kinase [Steroidobacter cummioxidans]|uniref:CHASE2 domain-containing serine/threonine-protein kinase n=1 Tax=Steroidobacter cummioxidans TaxID=1803913 RepID=UPI000E30E74A|nr:serine/threonine-protein kinase [Steroidobacter cummioxidans]